MGERGRKCQAVDFNLVLVRASNVSLATVDDLTKVPVLFEVVLSLEALAAHVARVGHVVAVTALVDHQVVRLSIRARLSTAGHDWQRVNSTLVKRRWQYLQTKSARGATRRLYAALLSSVSYGITANIFALDGFFARGRQRRQRNVHDAEVARHRLTCRTSQESRTGAVKVKLPCDCQTLRDRENGPVSEHRNVALCRYLRP